MNPKLKFFLFLLLLIDGRFVQAQCDDPVFQALEIRSLNVTYADWGREPHYEVSPVVVLRYKGIGALDYTVALVDPSGDTLLSNPSEWENFFNGASTDLNMGPLPKKEWQSHYTGSSGTVTVYCTVSQPKNPSNKISAKKTFTVQLPPEPRVLGFSLVSFEPGYPENDHGAGVLSPKLNIRFSSNSKTAQSYLVDYLLIAEHGDTIAGETGMEADLNPNGAEEIELRSINYAQLVKTCRRTDTRIRCEVSIRHAGQDKAVKQVASLPFDMPGVPVPLSLKLESSYIRYSHSYNGLQFDLNNYVQLAYSGKYDDVQLTYDTELRNKKGEVLINVPGGTSYFDNPSLHPHYNHEYIYADDLPFEKIAGKIKPGGDSMLLRITVYNPAEPSTRVTAEKMFYVLLPEIPWHAVQPNGVRIIPGVNGDDGSKGIGLDVDINGTPAWRMQMEKLRTFGCSDLRVNMLLRRGNDISGDAQTTISDAYYNEKSRPDHIHLPYSTLHLAQGHYDGEILLVLKTNDNWSISDTVSVGTVSFDVPPQYALGADVHWTRAPFAAECGYDEHTFSLRTGDRDSSFQSDYTAYAFVDRTMNFNLLVYPGERVDLGVTDEHTKRFLLFFKSRYDHYHFYDSVTIPDHPDSLVHTLRYEGKTYGTMRIGMRELPLAENFHADLAHNQIMNDALGMSISSSGSIRLPAAKKTPLETVVFCDGGKITSRPTELDAEGHFTADIFVPYEKMPYNGKTLTVVIMDHTYGNRQVAQQNISLPVLPDQESLPQINMERMTDTVVSGMHGIAVHWQLLLPAQYARPPYTFSFSVGHLPNDASAPEQLPTKRIPAATGWIGTSGGQFVPFSDLDEKEVRFTASVTGRRHDTIAQQSVKYTPEHNAASYFQVSVEASTKKKKWKKVSAYSRYTIELRTGHQLKTIEIDSVRAFGEVLKSFRAAPGDSIRLRLLQYRYRYSYGKNYTTETPSPLAEWNGLVAAGDKIVFQPVVPDDTTKSLIGLLNIRTDSKSSPGRKKR